MDSKLLVLFIVGIIFFSEFAIEASVCVVPEVPEAIGRAEAIFVGKIIDVTAVADSQGSSSTGSNYSVKFEIEQSWKGTISKELRVCGVRRWLPVPLFQLVKLVKGIWFMLMPGRTSVAQLTQSLRSPSLIELVFAPSSNRGARAEPTIGSAPEFVVITPELNRRDASQDIAALRQIKQCGCLLPSSLPSCSATTRAWRGQTPRDVDISSRESECCICLRRITKSARRGDL